MREQHRTTETWLTLADAKSAITKKAMRVAQKALSRAIKDYKKSEDFEQEVLEDSNEAY